MRTVARTILLLTVCCSNLRAADIKEAKWSLALNQRGVKVYTRKIEGIDFKEFKGVVTIETSLASLVALVMDANAAPNWMKNCSQSQVLKQTSSREATFYSLSRAPWPVKDRDSIIHHLISQDPETRIVTIKQTSKPDTIKEKKGVIRVKRIEGAWQFTPQKEGTVEVVYQVLSNPGGAIPAWLVNTMVVSQPYETLLKMQKVVLRDKYQQAKLPSLKRQ